MSSIQQSALTRMAAIATLLMVVATASNSAGPDRPALAADDHNFLGSWGDEIGVLHGPAGLAVHDGRVHVCNLLGNKVSVFDRSGTPLLGFGGLGLLSENGLFSYPAGVAIDDDGTIYALDADNDRVQLFSSNGVWQSNLEGTMRHPEGIALMADGLILIADTYNHRIQRYDFKGTLVDEWGEYGTGAGQFIFPRGVAVAPDGTIFVADTGGFDDGHPGNHRIQWFSAPTVYGGEWGEPGSGTGQFDLPMNVAVHPDPETKEVYVTDFGNHRVQVFDYEGEFLRAWGSVGQEDGQFSLPYGIAVDQDNYVYVSEFGNQRVQRFNRMGGHVSTWGRSGNGDGLFNSPWRIAVGGHQAVYVADTANHRIQRFTQDGAYLGQWGTQGSADGQFIDPIGVALDPLGKVYVVDRLNNRVQKFDADGNWITSWGEYGSGNGQFADPIGIAVGSDFRVYVTERGTPTANNDRVQVFTADGDWLATWGSHGDGVGEFNDPMGVAVSSGYVFVADMGNFRIQRFNLDFDPKGSASVGFIVDVAVDAYGYIYAVDLAQHSVTKMDDYWTVQDEWGVQGYKESQFSYPGGIAVDANGTVYVADTGNQRIKRYGDYPVRDPVYGLTLNGAFEESPALIRWTYGGELPVTVFPSADKGTQAARLGAPVSQEPRPREEGWLYQTVFVPFNWIRPVLTFDYRIFANDTIDYSDFTVTLTQSDGRQLELIVRDGYRSCIGPFAPPAGYDLGWRSAGFDLSGYQGRTVRVRFTVHNLHAGSYGIWALVDNVRLTNAGPRPTLPGPNRTYLPNIYHQYGCDLVPGW